MSGRPWTPTEDTTLTTAWAQHQGSATQFEQDLAEQLGRTPRSIQERRAQLGLVTRETTRPWTPDEDATIAAGHPLGDTHLAEQLGRTLTAIYQRRTVLRKAGIECVRNGIPGGAARRAGSNAKKRTRPTTPDTPNTPTHTGPLPAGWYGPPGSGHGPGEKWVPGAAFRRPA